MHDAQPAQDFVKQRPDGRLAKHLLLFQITRRDDEILQGATFQVIHHHVNGFVFAKEIQHAHDRAVGNLGQCPAFLEKTLETQPVKRKFVRIHLRQQFTRRAGCQRRRKVLLDRNLLTFVVHRQVN